MVSFSSWWYKSLVWLLLNLLMVKGARGLDKHVGGAGTGVCIF